MSIKLGNIMENGIVLEKLVQQAKEAGYVESYASPERVIYTKNKRSVIVLSNGDIYGE